MATSGPFPGGKKTGGRVAGTPNKVTFDLIEMLRAKGFEPAAALVETYTHAMDDFKRHEFNRALAEKKMNENLGEDSVPFKVGMDDGAREALKIATHAAAQLMQYTHPKRKAIEHTGAGGEPLELKPVVFYLPDNGRSKRD